MTNSLSPTPDLASRRGRDSMPGRALSAKFTARGKIQLRCCHGRIASASRAAPYRCTADLCDNAATRDRENSGRKKNVFVLTAGRTKSSADQPAKACPCHTKLREFTALPYVATRMVESTRVRYSHRMETAIILLVATVGALSGFGAIMLVLASRRAPYGVETDRGFYFVAPPVEMKLATSPAGDREPVRGSMLHPTSLTV